MITNELLDYVKKEQLLGKSVGEIKKSLTENGWAEADVSEAFVSLGIPHINLPPPPQNINVQPLIVEKKKRHFGQILGLVILVLVLSGGAYAYSAGYFSSLDKISMKSFNSIKKAQSGTFDTTVTIDMSDLSKTSSGVENILPGTTIPKSVGVTMAGTYDLFDEENPKASGSISVDAGAFSVQAEIISLDKTLYGKLTKAPTLGIVVNLNSYLNKWISFSLDKELNPTQSLPFMSFMGIDQRTINSLTDEQKEKLYDITDKAQFITISKKLAPETINDVNTYHFAFDLNKEGIKKYIDEVASYIRDIGKNNSMQSSFDPKYFIETLDKIESFSGEAWIGKKDSMPYKFIIDISQKVNEVDGSLIKIKIVSIFKDWNIRKEITAPPSSQTLEQFIKSMEEDENNPLGQAKLKANSASISSSLSSARAESEIYFDQSYSYSGLCLSRKITEIKNSLSLENPKDFVCLADKNNYAISAKLPTGGYFCVDSTGVAKNTTKVHTKTECPN